MQILKSSEELQQAIANKKILIVQFGADTCAPCHAIRNKIDAWCSNMEDVQYLYIPMEAFSALAAQESVFTVPTIFVYVEGKLTLRESGYFGIDSVFQSIQRCREMLQE